MHAAAPIRNYILGEFNDSVALLEATTKLREEKHGFLDTHTPYPVPGIERALDLPKSKVSLVAFGGGVAGVATAFFLQLYFNWFDYPMNIGNKPPFGAPVYVPITFELMVLIASLSIVGALIVYFWGMPQPYHPLFEHAPFINATSTGWWVSIETDEAQVAKKAKARLEELGAKNVAIVEDTP